MVLTGSLLLEVRPVEATSAVRGQEEEVGRRGSPKM